MRNKLPLFTVLAVVIGLVSWSFFTPAANACGFWNPCAASQTDAQTVQANQSRLSKAVPPPKLDTSLERVNISKRLQLFSNENKISYIYLTSYGKVMAFYTVKGKITSGSKRLTSAQSLVDSCGNVLQPGIDMPCGSDPGSVITAPELDGTYGESAQYIFFWTTDGTYVQWNGEYMLADQPLQLTTQPELVRAVK